MVIGGDLAWVTYDQVSRRDDPEFILNGVQHELKIFHRVGGQWKIACAVVLAQQVEHLSEPIVEVRPDMTVAWINPGGSRMLGNHPGLEIGGNRLRARNRPFNEGLREAVKWAFERLSVNPQKNRGGSDRIRAVALGEDDEGSPRFCWVFIEDGKVLVAFDEPGARAEQLERARSLFGLSPGQMRLLGLVIQGQELAVAAENLGVSVNTARTQLNRVFAKMGVHNQTAMVRRLVSLRVPTKG
jgi:DNA-binding CsgD family transcriptional regulator